MRHPLRLIAPVVAVAALVLGGASSALAAAAPSSASLDANWCFQDQATEYCFDVTGTVHYNDNQAGSTVDIHQTTLTTVYESGQDVGESKAVESFRGVFAADGSVTMKSNINTRSTTGDQSCTYRLVLRIVDYEALLDHETSTCGA